MTKIGEIEKRTGVHRLRIGKMKKELFGDKELSDEDWKKLEQMLAPPEEDILSEHVRCYIYATSENFPNFVQGKPADRKGKLYWISVPYGMNDKKYVGTVQKVERITYKDKEYYRHGMLSNKKFNERFYKGHDKE